MLVPHIHIGEVMMLLTVRFINGLGVISLIQNDVVTVADQTDDWSGRMLIINIRET